MVTSGGTILTKKVCESQMCYVSALQVAATVYTHVKTHLALHTRGNLYSVEKSGRPSQQGTQGEISTL